MGALLGRFRKGVAPQLLTQLLGGVHSIFGERASERVECRSRSIAALLGPSIQYGILPLPPPLVSYPILSALICMCNASPFLSAVAAVTMVAAISMGVAR